MKGELNGGTLVMKVRTCQDSMMSGTMSWDDCPAVTNGQDISSLVSVNDGDRYIQYYGNLSTNDIYTTPLLNSVIINFSPSSIKEVIKDKKKADINITNIAPNPFINRTRIRYSYRGNYKEEGKPIVEIYDLRGRKVKTLRVTDSKNGNSSICWHGDNEEGQTVPSGIYFLHLVWNFKRYGIEKIIKLR